MLKNIQNNLLLRHPLLWNTKFVPVLAAMVIIHILFFAFGLAAGTIDFTVTESWEYRFNDTSITVGFFSVFIAILAIIVWLVFYFRNNAFKSFYPKANNSLYKEWLIIAVICILNCSYFVSYEVGKNLRARSYFPEEEFSRRIDVISMASLFADGPYSEKEFFYENKNGNTIKMKRDSFEYNHRKYAINSLLNKNIIQFTYQNREKDSLNELRVKTWLTENRKDSVVWLMAELDKIAKGHNAKGNITPKKWAELVYNYPDYTDYVTVGKIDQYIPNPSDDMAYYEYDTDYTTIAPAQAQETFTDTISNTYKYINGQEHVFPKYYVPLKQLSTSYNVMSTAWSKPLINFELLLFYIYYGLVLSLAVFSFRVTSGRNWLITLVAIGVMGILTGIFSLIVHAESFFSFIWMVIIIAMLIYYISTCRAKTSKGLSAIALTGLLWLAPWFMLLLHNMICDFIYWKYTGYDYPIPERTPLESWIIRNSIAIWTANIFIVFTYMFFLSRSIKKWKGIAEA